MAKRESNNWVKALSEAVNMVTSIAAAVGGCGFAGYFLDKKLNTDPWLTLVGGFLGMATAMKIIWNKIKEK